MCTVYCNLNCTSIDRDQPNECMDTGVQLGVVDGHGSNMILITISATWTISPLEWPVSCTSSMGHKNNITSCWCMPSCDASISTFKLNPTLSEKSPGHQEPGTPFFCTVKHIITSRSRPRPTAGVKAPDPVKSVADCRQSPEVGGKFEL